MNTKYRKTIIAGNWKMNKLVSETRPFADSLKTLLPKEKSCEVVLCAPFVNLSAMTRAFKDTRVSVGAQNLNENESGAFTGEISGAMLRDIGVKYVIIGHSERRAYYGETDLSVNKKALAACDAGLRPIICVGETLGQREMGITLELIRLQVKTALAGLSADKIRKVVFAYEPIWAIGTGKTPTSEQAGEVCMTIRREIRALYGARIARAISILYGGSMNEQNAADLLSQPDIDGGLIGGASLKPASFAAIVSAAGQE